jgi:hypothetical protein
MALVYIGTLLAVHQFELAKLAFERQVLIADYRVRVQFANSSLQYVATGAVAEWCGDEPSALGACSVDYHARITINNNYLPPSVGTILHELAHGLVDARGYIGHVKTDGSHLANPRSLMYHAVNGDAQEYDADTLYVLSRIGYLTVSAAAQCQSLQSILVFALISAAILA